MSVGTSICQRSEPFSLHPRVQNLKSDNKHEAVAKVRRNSLKMLHRLTCALLALVVANLLWLPSAVIARDYSAGLPLTYTSGSSSMPYRLYLPENYDSNASYPLVLFLHGAGESGTNNTLQVIIHISGLIDQTFSNYPAILIAPQLPSSSGWSPANPVDLTPGILQSVINDYAVDTNRLYVTGLSMGGFGSMRYLDSYTDGAGLEFASAISMHGGYTYTPNPQAVEHFSHVPIWLIHGSNDTTVPAQYLQNTYRSLLEITAAEPIIFNETHLGHPTAVSGNSRYTEILGAGHGGWTALYRNTELYDWMFAQSVPEPTGFALAAVGLFVASAAFRSHWYPMSTAPIAKCASRRA
jgi:predicted peptidase